MKRYLERVFVKFGKEKALTGRLAAVCLAGCLSLALTGCGAGNAYDSGAAAEMSAPQMNSSASSSMAGGAMFEESVEYQLSSADENVEVTDTSRKLIKTVDMDVETKEFDVLMETLERQVTELGGYIEDMDIYNGSSYSSYRARRNATLTIRIPQDQLESFLSTVSDISNVVRSSEYVEDVTLTYVDLESRRNMLQVERDRLLELLEQAESIEDIIVIESRLSEVRYQIESMESQLRTFDNRVDYSTVHLSVDEVRELTPVEERTAWQRMGEGFMDSVRDVIDGLAEFGIWFVIHIPYLILWALVLAVFTLVIWLIVKKYYKKQMRQREQRQQMAAQNKNVLGGSVQSGNAQNSSVQNSDQQK